MFDRNLSEVIIEKYGTELQPVILIEELSELQKEITKCMRGKANLQHLAEEIAHCIISIDVIMDVYYISESDVQKEIDKKRKKIERGYK